MASPAHPSASYESPYAWARLVVSLMLMTFGGVGMYVVPVALPAGAGRVRRRARRRVDALHGA